MPISTFPRHDDYEDEYLLKPAGLRDTQSEGKVTVLVTLLQILPPICLLFVPQQQCGCLWTTYFSTSPCLCKP